MCVCVVCAWCKYPVVYLFVILKNCFGNVSLKNTEDAISCAFLFFTNRIVNKIERLSTIYYLKIEKSAEIMDAYDFCGLRYAKTDPKQWQEKFKLPRFVYFSLRLE